LSDPHYACYPNTVSFMGGKPVFFDLKEDEGFVYSGGRVKEKISPRTRALMVNSPSNPTGIVLDRANLAQIADGFPGFIISDEIYHRVVYGEKAHSILEFTDRAFVLNGFSKLYAMTGWRLGYIIAPMDFIRSLHKIHQNFFLSANAFVQKAGVAALKGPQDSSAQMVRVYNQRRQFLIRELRKLGFGITVEPTGAFYVLANARRYGADSVALANRILTQAGVAVTPGIDFGKNAEGYLRFSYATSLNEIKKAIHRIGEWLNK
ncbi:aminotransferase class I/II-fold pyridoxal phosphate-dependent enzyme, partial [candidate division KSB1 bacterium]|nr:aminotransferase class I/II-fold pyridoxal phosphate-dependent enzyme [candidate division KSB1 bacterium]